MSLTRQPGCGWGVAQNKTPHSPRLPALRHWLLQPSSGDPQQFLRGWTGMRQTLWGHTQGLSLECCLWITHLFVLCVHSQPFGILQYLCTHSCSWVVDVPAASQRGRCTRPALGARPTCFCGLIVFIIQFFQHNLLVRLVGIRSYAFPVHFRAGNACLML